MSREAMLMKLYWKLWTSADFESDFQQGWFAVYQQMQDGNHDNIPTVVIEACYQYLMEWEKEWENF